MIGKSAKIILFVLLLSAAGILFGCSGSRDSYEKGAEAFLSGKYEDGVRYFRLAISQGKKEGYVYADLALCYERLGETDEALQNLNRALELSPDDPLVKKKIGMFYEAQGDDQTALSYYNASITTEIGSMSENDLETCAMAAALERKNGCFLEAIRIYDILINENYFPIQHEIMTGECYLSLHQNAAACQYFDLIDGRSETEAVWYLLIYEDLIREGYPVDAERYLEKGLSLCGEKSMSRAEYYAAAGRFPEVENEALPDDESEGSLIASSVRFLHNRDFEGAEKCFLKLLQNGNASGRIYNRYMVLKIMEEDYTSALQLLTQVETSPEDSVLSDGAWNEIVLYERIGNFDMARQKMIQYMKNYRVNDTVLREYYFLKR